MKSLSSKFHKSFPQSNSIIVDASAVPKRLDYWGSAVMAATAPIAKIIACQKITDVRSTYKSFRGEKCKRTIPIPTSQQQK